MSTELRKPPRGIVPKYIYEETKARERMLEIEFAMLRKSAIGELWPQEWVDEEYELSNKIYSNT